MAKILNEDFSNIDKLMSVEDYPFWKFQIEILLRANNLFEIVSLDKPIDECTEKWKKEDATAQKIIIVGVIADITQKVSTK